MNAKDPKVFVNGERVKIVPGSVKFVMGNKWQSHPSTLTGHAFAGDAKPGDNSICGRAQLTSAPYHDRDKAFYECTACIKKLTK